MVYLNSLAAFAATVSIAIAHPAGDLLERQSSQAQRFLCGTQTTPADVAAIQEVAAAGAYEGFEGLHARDRLVGRDVTYPWGNVTIKTWIHVISVNESVSGGNVPASQLTAQMDYLNTHFAPAKFQFSLEGITRTVNADWAVDPAEAELQYKTKLRRGDYATLNLYFIYRLFDDNLGYAYYPSKEGSVKGSEEFYLDAASNNAATVPGGSFTNYNLGGTVLHEVGHWMGLMHTFGDNPYTCDGPGDYVADTPAQLGPTSRCPTSRDSCPGIPGLDPIHNWMDYSYDICYEEFTPLQTKRMWDAWFYYRKPRGCNADNCLRAMRSSSVPGRLEESQAFCTEITQTIVTEVSAFKQYAVDACGSNVASRVSSACSCLVAPTSFPQV